MIRLTEALPPYFPDPVFAHIACLYSAFSDSVLAPELWVQEEKGQTVGIIARQGGRCYLWSDGNCTDELVDFLEVIGRSEIFCSVDTAQRCGFEVLEPFFALHKKIGEKSGAPNTEVSLSALYKGFSEGSDGDIDLPDFEIFAPDVSHRLRHGGASVHLSDRGAGLVFLFDGGGIINGISVPIKNRKSGAGSEILADLCRTAGGDVFAFAKENSLKFYEKNGFSVVYTAVITR